MKTLVAVAAAVLLAAPVRAAVRSKAVEYKDGNTVLEGFAYWDDGFKDKRPGVLVAHEWYGNGPYSKRRAEMLAKLGYTAFALDMYGKGVYATNHEEAGKLAGAFFNDRAAMRRRAMLAVEQLKKLPYVDDSKLAAIGYCFGGTTVLELARMGADLKGVASFHGNLATPTPATEKPKAKIAVFQGADDKMTMPAVPAFEDEMRKAGADWEFTAYGGAVHSFTVEEAGSDKSTGMAYNKEADERSWKALQDFFAEIFR
ncbi:MAG TPA: dienelactone hydrolase family protein [Elusimicrobiota bacterium]|nr:dienelactone hydrolase family protein [Elusimicrobiota bacterium]